MIGLDIGTYSIKAVELEKKDDALILVNFKILERPQESQEPLSNALKKFFEEGNFNSREANISVAGPLAIARLVELPEMSDEEIKNAVKFEVEKYIPFNIEDAILDYEVISKKPDLKKIVILIAAVKNDFLKTYINAVTRFGFVVKGVDVDGIALTNAFLNAAVKTEEGRDKAVALLNFGDTFLNEAVVYQGIPYMLRDINDCGKAFTEEIAKSLGLNKKEAYQLKHSPPPDQKENLFEAIRPSLDKLAKEIRLSLGYFENQFAKSVEKIYLSGGSSRLFGLKEFLSESLEFPVESWDVFGAIKVGENVFVKSLEESRTDLAVALGLALRND